MDKLDFAFRKYSQNGDHLTKLAFKQAFVFLTGLEPSKEDMRVVKEYLNGEFRVNLADFTRIMGLYLRQL
jgi:hypothetical protein